MDHLMPAYGGTLVNLMASAERAAELRQHSRDWPSLDLEPRHLGDLELLLNGGFSPLDGYMDRADWSGCLEEMRLADGTLWPIPVALDIPPALAEQLEGGSMLGLRDQEGVLLAALQVSEVWRPDWAREARVVCAGATTTQAEVERAAGERHTMAVAGQLEGVQLPVHYDYRELRSTPAELRRTFARLGWRQVLAYQTHQTMHRAHQALTQRTAQELGTNLLIHPLVGHGLAGDPDYYTRVRCYRALLAHYPKDMVRLSLLPLWSRGGGPREAVLAAIVHRNHGCTHFMVEHDTGDSILDSNGAPAWEPREARALLDELREELGIVMVPFREMVYLESAREFVPADEVPPEGRTAKLSAPEVRKRLARGAELPDWFSFPEVERELRRRHPPRHQQGFTVFFTGLSGAGKSTIANALRVKLLEVGGRGVSLLDGDLVRKNLSSELGFSKEHRDLNILRIGFVAGEITRAGGVAICAPIAPYEAVRQRVRDMVSPWGGFVLVHVATPLTVCEERDRKGMYAKARAGLVDSFTGISDPYEEPVDAEVVVDASAVTPEEAVREVLLHLEAEGYISA